MAVMVEQESSRGSGAWMGRLLGVRGAGGEVERPRGGSYIAERRGREVARAAKGHGEGWQGDEGGRGRGTEVTETRQSSGTREGRGHGGGRRRGHGRALFLDGDGSPGKKTEGGMAQGDAVDHGEATGHG